MQKLTVIGVLSLVMFLVGCAHHTTTQTNMGYGTVQSVQTVPNRNWKAGDGTEIGVGVGALLGGLAGGLVGVATTIASLGLGSVSIPAFMAGGAAIGGVTAGVLGYGIDQVEKPDYVKQYAVQINLSHQVLNVLDGPDSSYQVGELVRVYESNGQYHITHN